ncbi:MAG TPA: hypothetical protein V6D37_00200, partial [Candidatus Sericytochromatia bacterium]
SGVTPYIRLKLDGEASKACLYFIYPSLTVNYFSLYASLFSEFCKRSNLHKVDLLRVTGEMGQRRCRDWSVNQDFEP